MRVYNIQLRFSEGVCELRADVKCDTHWVWGEDPFPLWYRYPLEYCNIINPENGDPFLAACLLPAMVLGESLEIEKPVSPKLYDHLDHIQSIYRCWDGKLAKVEVGACQRDANAQSDTVTSAEIGLLCALDVDAAYSLWKDTAQPHGGSITHLVAIHGLDVPLWDHDQFAAMLANVTRCAKQFSKAVLPIATNLREFSNRLVDWLQMYEGPAMASALLPLANKFREVSLPGSQTYTQLMPRGVHPLLDPLWSTEELSFKHDGLEADFVGKLKCIAEFKVLTQNLFVCCNHQASTEYNCGRCDTCIQTMIGLHIIGMLGECEAFPRDIDLAAIRNLPAPNPQSRQQLERLIQSLNRTPTDTAIKAALTSHLTPTAHPQVPIISITGTNGKTTTTRMVAHILAKAGHHVGFATTDGVYIGHRRTMKGDKAGMKGAQAVLRDPKVEVAVLETARGGLIQHGLSYPSCDVGVCLNVREDHLGQDGVETLEQLARVKRVIIENAQRAAVLNADDPQCVAMAEHASAPICYVSGNSDHPMMRRHIDAGGVGVVVERTRRAVSLVIYDRGEKQFSLAADLIPATLGGKAFHNIQNAMFAAAATYCLGASEAEIAQGLQTFSNSFEMSPGRMNFFDEHPFTVVLDFGHNPDGIRVVCEAVSRLDSTGRRIVLLTSPSNRTEDHFDGIGRSAAGHFDSYLCSNWYDLRGGDPAFVPRSLCEGLIRHGVDASNIAMCLDPENAVSKSLALAKPGDLVVIFGDDSTRRAEQIRQFSRKRPKPS